MRKLKIKLCTCGKTATGPLAQASHRRACDGRWWSDQAAYEMRVYAYEAQKKQKDT